MEAEYQRQGIHMYPTFCPQKVQKDPDGHFTVVAKNSQGKEMALTGMDTVLMATGRSPNSKGLGLEEVRCWYLGVRGGGICTRGEVGGGTVFECTGDGVICVCWLQMKAHRLARGALLDPRGGGRGGGGVTAV